MQNGTGSSPVPSPPVFRRSSGLARLHLHVHVGADVGSDLGACGIGSDMAGGTSAHSGGMNLRCLALRLLETRGDLALRLGRTHQVAELETHARGDLSPSVSIRSHLVD